MIKPLTNPLDPTKYSGDLIAKPAHWLVDWWQRRPLSMLFRGADRVAKIGNYQSLIAKIFGRSLKQPDGEHWLLYLDERVKSDGLMLLRFDFIRFVCSVTGRVTDLCCFQGSED